MGPGPAIPGIWSHLHLEIQTLKMDRALTRGLLACGTVAGPLFVVVFLIEGATRADYDSLRHTVSSLAIGDLGWMQQLNFIVTGLLMVAFAVGLRAALRRWGGSRSAPVLIALVGIGLIGAGILVADPGYGYPPGTPIFPEEPTISGALHDLFSVFVFFALPAACFVLGRRFLGWGQRGWAWYSIATGLVFLAGFALTIVALNWVDGPADIAGLLQRMTIVIGFAWLSLLSLHLPANPPRLAAP